MQSMPFFDEYVCRQKHHNETRKPMSNASKRILIRNHSLRTNFVVFHRPSHEHVHVCVYVHVHVHVNVQVHVHVHVNVRVRLKVPL